jgi:hypothetical protein
LRLAGQRGELPFEALEREREVERLGVLAQQGADGFEVVLSGCGDVQFGH